MNRNKTTFNMCFCAIMIALGVLFPEVLHIFGGSNIGQILLPMHFPVLIVGISLGPIYGGFTGVIIPILNCVLLGMPTPIKLPLMIGELFTYGFFTGILKQENIYLNIFISQMSGRIVDVLLTLVYIYALGLDIPPIISTLISFIKGIPGVVIQLILIPTIVKKIRKINVYKV